MEGRKIYNKAEWKGGKCTIKKKGGKMYNKGEGKGGKCTIQENRKDEKRRKNV